MIIDSLLKKAGDLARLVSPQFAFEPAGYCLRWYYHMYGADMGTMSVYIKVGDRLGLYWRLGENLFNIWNAAQITIPQIANFKNFSIVFEGERGPSTYSNMAIDDVRLDKGVCPTFGSCSFEDESYCDWFNVEDGRDEVDWEFGNGGTDSYGTGPR